MRLGRALVAVVLPVAMLTAACNASSDAVSTPETAGANTPTESGSGPANPGQSVVPVLDTEHAVAPPGPRRGPLLGPDMLVYSQDTLSAETIEAIRGIKGVTNVEVLSMAQVSIENKVLNLAAVDPGTYRRFTPRVSAELQEVWDRVAGGELALSADLKDKVPANAEGYLRLGNDKDAPRVHIGAYAPQIPRVDAVVNEKWAAELGMKPGNAVVLYTRGTSPQSVRTPIQEIAGDKASVQILGPDLDITVQQTAFLVGSVADAVGIFNYTVLGGGRIAPEPSWVASHIATGDVPILGSVTCNRLIFPQLRAALTEIVRLGLADKIHPGEYAGCYYPRFIAGTTSLSNHSFGTALDLNVPGNMRGSAGEIDRTVVSIFKRWGFSWGGDWSYTDPMHFEMNTLVDPR